MMTVLQAPPEPEPLSTLAVVDLVTAIISLAVVVISALVAFASRNKVSMLQSYQELNDKQLEALKDAGRLYSAESKRTHSHLKSLIKILGDSASKQGRSAGKPGPSSSARRGTR